MSLSNKVILSVILSAIAAAIAWYIMDFSGLFNISGGPQIASFGSQFARQSPLGMIFGICVGFAMALVDGISGGSKRKFLKSLAWGVGYGALGGLLGIFFGQLFFGALYISNSSSFSVYLWDVAIRAIGWAFIGFFLGAVQGIPSTSIKIGWHGAVGGFIGGFLGGILVEICPFILPPTIGNPSVTGRGIGMIVTGASIGFFIGLIQNLMMEAWVRVFQGKNEGREFIVSKIRTTLGRDELSDIGLFGDRAVAPLHAVIERNTSGRYVLKDFGTAIGTLVNGKEITKHVLRDGELIEIGTIEIEFFEKATASRLPRMSATRGGAKIPAGAGICQFCGGRKDPKTGNCACSVSSTPSKPSALPPADAPPTHELTMVQSPASVGARLIGMSGSYGGHDFALSPSAQTTVGRDDSRSIQLSLDTTVSRKHAYLVNEGGTFVVYDEGSSNGTFVNGNKITRQALVHGDKVAFGTALFRFEQ